MTKKVRNISKRHTTEAHNQIFNNQPLVRDISKRLLIESALLDYGRFLHVSEADIDELYLKIEKLNEDCFNDEKTFELVEKYNLDTITSREELKKRIETMRGQLAEKIFDYYATDDIPTDINRHRENIASVLKDIGIKGAVAGKLAQSICERKLKDELTPEENDKFNELAGKNSKRKKSSNKENPVRWADLLAKNIFDKQKILKEKIYLDRQTYKDMDLKNPIIEEFLPDIEANINGIQIVLNYTTPKETKPFRDKIRKDFEKEEGGSKRKTLTINGLLAENGKNLIKHPRLSSNYGEFEKRIKEYYGEEDYQQIIDKALNIKNSGKDEKMLYQERLQTYNQKSCELYCQLVASLLSEKRKYDIEKSKHDKENKDRFNYGEYVESILDYNYIHNLCKGENNVLALGMTEPTSKEAPANNSKEWEIHQQILKKTAEERIASVHHHLPVGAADDVITRSFGSLEDDEKLEKSCELVNQLGNNCLVVNKDKHQSMEAKGAYKVRHLSEGTIFAGRIDWTALNGIKDSLPENLWKAFEQNLKPNTKIQDVALNMRFPESKYMADLRQKLQPENTTSLSKVFERILE